MDHLFKDNQCAKTIPSLAEVAHSAQNLKFSSSRVYLKADSLAAKETVSYYADLPIEHLRACSNQWQNDLPIKARSNLEPLLCSTRSLWRKYFRNTNGGLQRNFQKGNEIFYAANGMPKKWQSRTKGLHTFKSRCETPLLWQYPTASISCWKYLRDFSSLSFPWCTCFHFKP